MSDPQRHTFVDLSLQPAQYVVRREELDYNQCD